MATCKVCSKTGWLLPLSPNGLCQDCGNRIAFEITGKVRIIKESLQIVDTSKNLDTRLSRLDLVMSHASSLLQYEKLGLHPTSPLPSEILESLEPRRPLLIEEGLQEELKEAIAKAEVARTITAKHNALSKALLRIREFKAKYPAQTKLTELESEANRLIHASQIQGFLDAAQKAEFKGQKKKALDQYQEALYYLQHNDVPDEQLPDHVALIKQKVKALGGEQAST